MKAKRQAEGNMALSLSLHKLLYNWQRYKEAKVIGVYISFKQEVDTLKIIDYSHKIGKIVVVVRIRENYQLDFVRVDDLTTLKKNKYGILEPDENETAYEGTIDLLLVPLVGYNDAGYRLGMGGGYYDRYLEKHPDLYTCGLAYSFQKTPFEVLSHDVPLKALVNEREIIEWKTTKENY